MTNHGTDPLPPPSPPPPRILFIFYLLQIDEPLIAPLHEVVEVTYSVFYLRRQIFERVPFALL